MKRAIALAALLVYMLIFTACHDNKTIQDIPDSSQNIELDGTNEFKKALGEHKIVFTTEEVKEKSMLIPGERLVFLIKGERVTIHQFPSTSEAKEYTSKFDNSGNTIGNADIEWAGKPHFYQKWNLIIEYIGESVVVVDILNNILGTEFSGYNAFSNTSHLGK